MVGRVSFLQGCDKEIHRQSRDSVGGGRWAAEGSEEGANPRSQWATLGMRVDLRQTPGFSQDLLCVNF